MSRVYKQENKFYNCCMEESKQSQIKQLLENYCSEYLNSELRTFVIRLFETIIQYPLMDINRGKPEIWAASIIHVIARLNFLMDKESENYVSFDELCSFFNTKKSTIGNKATQIEITYGIEFADENYTLPAISNSFRMSVTPEGFIVPDFMMGTFSKEEEEELERLEKERELARVQELERKKALKVKEKREAMDAGQFKLFD